MIEGLVLGKLHAPAIERIGSSGKRFVTAKVRAATSDAESTWINVIAFSDASCIRLLALEAGDAVVVGGTMKPSAWADHDGRSRSSLDLVASVVLTTFGLARKRKAVAAASAGAMAGDEGSHGDPVAGSDGGPLG